MLKLKDIFPDTKVICSEPDYYTKVNILFADRNRLKEVSYWSTLGEQGLLIEIGLDQSTGLIFGITLVGPTIVLHENAPHIFNNAIKKIGLPLFVTDPWKPKVNPLGYHVEFYERDTYIEEENGFAVHAEKQNITIVLSTFPVVLHVINDPIIFGFDSDNNLCYIHMKNMILNDEGFLKVLP